MKPIEIDEIRDHMAYERIRDEYRAHLIELKQPRRIAVGSKLTFIFENRETVLFQIQEMLRAEHTVKPEKIQAEIDVYNELIPGDHELSTTLMIEILELAQIKQELDRLVGIDEHIYLDVGDRTVRAAFDEKQFEEDRISAVQYIRFPLGRSLAGAFSDPAVAVRLRIDHPNYRESTALEGASRDSLAADLRPEDS